MTDITLLASKVLPPQFLQIGQEGIIDVNEFSHVGRECAETMIYMRNGSKLVTRLSVDEVMKLLVKGAK